MIEIILAVLVVIGIYVGSIYNSLVSLNNRVINSWSQINVQLKKRADLIPSLVEIVKGYSKYEKQTLTDITRFRTELMQTSSVSKKYELNKKLSKELKQIFVVAENYPTLKANENFLKLQEELSDIENKIAFTRQFYNDTVYKYNTEVKSFPSNIVSGLFKFHLKESFNEESKYEGVKL
ncbi:LemA family protein [Candidatus Tiddalikarchaeum anstoanum]|nr:LemA family protein [Candidatus Tiddalikarchaeum anstoanum]